MTLEIILSAYLLKLLPSSSEGEVQTRSRMVEFDNPVTPEAILNQLALPLREVSVITFDGQRIGSDRTITSDGVIRFFPSIIGG